MNYLIRLKGELYKPIIVKDCVGRDILDLTPVSCGTCRYFTACDNLAASSHGNVADDCENWEGR